jgi:hypothetical protein
MAKHPGCWANALDDCSGQLTAEHLLPTSVWEPADGKPNSRENRLRTPIALTLQSDGSETVRRDLTVRNHTARILCERHNAGTSELDAEAGRLAASIRGYFDVHKIREPLTKLTWNVHRFPVSGPLIERWLLKAAVNNLFDQNVRIGSPEAQAGWPARDLVEWVFGVRPVPREQGAGLFLVDHACNVGDGYQLGTVERSGTHASTFVMSYGVFHLGVQLEARHPSQSQIDAVRHLRGGRIVRPAISVRTITNVELRFLW